MQKASLAKLVTLAVFAGCISGQIADAANISPIHYTLTDLGGFIGLSMND